MTVIISDAVAAAIRATWPAHMRKTYADVPGIFTHCACQHGITSACAKGRHDRCVRAEPLRTPETSICDQRGMVTFFPEVYQHVSDVSATGPRHTSVAQVWLADRVCRWQCGCACHTTPAPAASPAAVPGPVQLDLFALNGARS